MIYEAGVDIDTAVASLMETLRESSEGMQRAAAALLSTTKHGSETGIGLGAFLSTFWTVMTGNYT